MLLVSGCPGKAWGDKYLNPSDFFPFCLPPPTRSGLLGDIPNLKLL